MTTEPRDGRNIALLIDSDNASPQEASGKVPLQSKEGDRARRPDERPALVPRDPARAEKLLQANAQSQTTEFDEWG